MCNVEALGRLGCAQTILAAEGVRFELVVTDGHRLTTRKHQRHSQETKPLVLRRKDEHIGIEKGEQTTHIILLACFQQGWDVLVGSDRGKYYSFVARRKAGCP